MKHHTEPAEKMCPKSVPATATGSAPPWCLPTWVSPWKIMPREELSDSSKQEWKKDCQCAFSTYNTTKHSENKPPKGCGITKVKSLQAILHNQPACKCLNVCSYKPTCFEVHSARFLHLYQKALSLWDSWVKLPCSFLSATRAPNPHFLFQQLPCALWLLLFLTIALRRPELPDHVYTSTA